MATARTADGIVPAAGAKLNVFARYLTLWVALCIGAGILLGRLFPGAFEALARAEVARVNTVVGGLVEVPVMLSVVAIVNRSRGWYERGAA